MSRGARFPLDTVGRIRRWMTQLCERVVLLNKGKTVVSVQLPCWCDDSEERYYGTK